MKRHRTIFVTLIVLVFLWGTSRISAQQSFSERFTGHNRAMAAWQPVFITPLVGTDPRLVQYTKFSVSHEYTSAGAETVNYGNGRGTGIIAGNRFEFVHPATLYPAQQRGR